MSVSGNGKGEEEASREDCVVPASTHNSPAGDENRRGSSVQNDIANDVQPENSELAIQFRTKGTLSLDRSRRSLGAAHAKCFRDVVAATEELQGAVYTTLYLMEILVIWFAPACCVGRCSKRG